MTAEPLGAPKGVDERLVEEISSLRGEPAWLVAQRRDALRSAAELPVPDWWQSDVDGDLDRLPVLVEPPRRWGTGSRHDVIDQETVVTAAAGGARAATADDGALVFSRRLLALERDGVVFCDLGTAVTEHGQRVRPYLGSLVADGQDRLGALAAALWSGGTFLYVPPGVHVDVPLQSYARLRSESPDRFERTLIVADEGASVHYIEGCASPVYSTEQVRGGSVEIVVGPSAEVSYTTVQNWSANVTEATTTVAEVHTGGSLLWTAGNIGARRTVRRTTCRLAGSGATGVARTVSYAGHQQTQSSTVEMILAASDTHAEVGSRSVADGAGEVEHRDRIVVDSPGAVLAGCTSVVQGDGLTLDEQSSVRVAAAFDGHDGEAPSTKSGVVAAIDEDQRFYLMSRGLSFAQATALLVSGFINPVTRTLPTEYAVEWTRLIELQLEGAVG